MVKKRTERIVLTPENKKEKLEDFQPSMGYYESNKHCYVKIDCPTYKKAGDLIKQILKDQKDLVRVKKQLKEYKDKETRLKKEIHERLNAPVFKPDYNCPG